MAHWSHVPISGTSGDELQSLFCNETDLARVREGEISTLIRFGKKPIVIGDLELSSGLSREIVIVRRSFYARLATVGDGNARRAGYESVKTFEAAWQVHFNPDRGNDPELTVIHFEIK